MRSSEQINDLAAALALCEFPAILKSHSANVGQYGYTYADLADTVAATGPILRANGLSVVQFPEIEDGKDVLTTRVMHASGQWIEGSMRLLIGKQDSQGLGSAITYARRYAYCAALGIVADEDDDGRAASRPRPQQQARQTVNRETGEVTDDPAAMSLKELTLALQAAGLALTGTSVEKRQRLAEYRASVGGNGSVAPPEPLDAVVAVPHPESEMSAEELAQYPEEPF